MNHNEIHIIFSVDCIEA